VAAALAALAENDFITGAEIPVDGGMTMRMGWCQTYPSLTEGRL